MTQRLITPEHMLSGELPVWAMRAYLDDVFVLGYPDTEISTAVNDDNMDVSVVVRFKNKVVIDRIDLIRDDIIMTNHIHGGPTTIEPGGTVTITQRVILETFNEDDEGVVIG